MRLGVIADTHGLLRSEVFEVFRQVDHILHGGDVGPERLLDELQAIAPVTAVYGNTDGWALRAQLPRVARVELDGFTIVVTHGDQFGSPTPEKTAGGVSRRGDHRLRPHASARAHAGGRGGHRDEPRRRRSAPVRPAGLGRHPGARARHSAPGPADPAHPGRRDLAYARRAHRADRAPDESLPSRPGRHPSDPRGLRRAALRRAARYARLGRTPGHDPDPPGTCLPLAPAGRRHGVRCRQDPGPKRAPGRMRSPCAWMSRATGRPARRTTTSRSLCVAYSTAASSTAGAAGAGSLRWTIRTGASDGPHGGGGWEAAAASDSTGWSVVLRLDPAWVDGEAGRWPAIAFVLHDDDPNGWYALAAPERPGTAAPLEDSPASWTVGPAR